MRATRHGWLLLALGIALVIGGRVFSIWELYVLGAAAIGLVLVAVTLTGLSRLRLHVTRTISPTRLHAGQPARVDIHVVNRSGRTPVLRLVDPVQHTSGADIMVGPLHGGETTTVAYQLPTERRGVTDVGPLTVEIGDPFGLAKLRVPAAGRHSVTVYPRVHPIDPVPFTVGDDPHGGAPTPNALGRTGDDFYALRQYTVGDDLRRVHWKSTARHDDLMVRQHDQPWQGRLTVLLDTRKRIDDEEPFEIAVQAAASVLVASGRRRDLVRLVTTDSGDSGFAAGGSHVDSMMEYLASASPTPAGTLLAARDTILSAGGGGALVVCLAGPTDAEVDEMSRMRRAFGNVTVISATARPETEPVRRAAPGITLIRARDGAGFADAWTVAHGRRSPGNGSAPNAVSPSDGATPEPQRVGASQPGGDQ